MFVLRFCYINFIVRSWQKRQEERERDREWYENRRDRDWQERNDAVADAKQEADKWKDAYITHLKGQVEKSEQEKVSNVEKSRPVIHGCELASSMHFR